MIKVTKLNKEEVYINPDRIETLEASPDTAIFFHGGKRMVVREPIEEVVERFLRYKKLINSAVGIRKEARE